MAGFELQTSTVGSGRSTDWATSTARIYVLFCLSLSLSLSFVSYNVVYAKTTPHPSNRAMVYTQVV